MAPQVAGQGGTLELEPGEVLEWESRTVLNRNGATVRPITDEELKALGIDVPVSDAETAASAAEQHHALLAELKAMRAELDAVKSAEAKSRAKEEAKAKPAAKPAGAKG